MLIDYDYLIKQLMLFRNIMCSTKFTVEQKDNAFNGLVYAYLHHNIPIGKNKNVIITLFEATSIEWERRRLFEVFHK